MSAEEEAAKQAARKKELAEAMADGLDIFETRRNERIAKEKAADPEGGKDDDADNRSFADRFLGLF